MPTVNQLQYVTAQTLQDPTNTDSTCSIDEINCRPMPTDTDRIYVAVCLHL